MRLLAVIYYNANVIVTENHLRFVSVCNYHAAIFYRQGQNGIDTSRVLRSNPT